MKTKILLVISFILAIPINVFTQVNITSEKVTYQRNQENLPDYKKTFEITYPKISGVNNPTIKKNLEDTLDYWKNFDESLEENLNESYGIDSADFVVDYNKNSILAVTLVLDFSGAYPTTFSKRLVIDATTGKRVFLQDVFSDVGQIIVKIDKAKRADEKKAIAMRKRVDPKAAETLSQRLAGSNYSTNTIEEFSVSDAGVTFYFDYGFPHAIKAFAPDGIYFFGWTELMPFVKKDGLFGQFIK